MKVEKDPPWHQEKVVRTENGDVAREKDGDKLSHSE